MAEDVRHTYEEQPALPIFGEETVWYSREYAPEPGQAQYEATHSRKMSVNEIDSLEDSMLRSVLWRQFGRRTAPLSSPLSRDALIVGATADDRFKFKVTVPRGSLNLPPPPAETTE